MPVGARLFLTFFYQAEDGIRDGHVTGVQTCALPISDEDDRRTEAISAISAIAPGALDTELEGSEQLSAAIVTLLAPAAEDSDLDPELRAQIWPLLVDHQPAPPTGPMPPQDDAGVLDSAAAA